MVVCSIEISVIEWEGNCWAIVCCILSTWPDNLSVAWELTRPVAWEFTRLVFGNTFFANLVVGKSSTREWAWSFNRHYNGFWGPIIFMGTQFMLSICWRPLLSGWQCVLWLESKRLFLEHGSFHVRWAAKWNYTKNEIDCVDLGCCL